MEDQQGQEANSPSQGSERNEPVRSRWTPKPEQILILESIFNSGMVNPPKDETVRIRKLLEKFGSVGDANVFYWFQNRRSRSRRRQRQMQANLEQRNQAQAQPQLVVTSTGGATQLFESSSGFSFGPLSSPSYHLGSSSSSCGVMGNDVAVDQCPFSVSGQMGFPEIEQSSAVTPGLCASDTSNLQYQSEVPRGPLDMKAMFGQDVVLVHSSGVPVPINEFGFLIQGLQHGESYFLVSRPT
ncbi:WUSCHEL-related homeobox 11 isoform X3 [Quercus suber]|uniref:WUSCHEL-related homeobox 11 isoform X3 n=1 Tax=Quercus suber TaxID=58331 RepID=UPI000CE1F989|nr:WUSCHEL-related homeobox 11-like isoform X3 [Quercus suber]